jgi:hypothetical protein
MGLTPAQIDGLPDYTNAQMVKLIRKGIVDLVSSSAVEVIINNRRFVYRDLGQLQNMLKDFEEMAAIDEANQQLGDAQCPVMGYHTDIL